MDAKYVTASLSALCNLATLHFYMSLAKKFPNISKPWVVVSVVILGAVGWVLFWGMWLDRS